MSTKIRLTALSFMQFFVWGSWLISLGGYMGANLGFSGMQIGSVYATMGIASVFMPGLLGIIADRWVNAERVLGIAHILGAVALIGVANVSDFSTFYT
ncbi:MAG TPA: MFS transporter, partial [Sphingobacteriaceae bacterium]|nr:MFS transporter [Sphingobacteriaceae bacterium]